jgi:heat shock protein HslJ
MKSYKLIPIGLLALLAGLQLPSCHKEPVTSSIEGTKWKVWSITAPDRDFILISPTPYQVSFNKDNIYNMRLDINSCGSTYKVEDENKIFIEPIACTEICCDKAFADTLLNILKRVNSYNISQESLELISSNRIINFTKVTE